MKTGRISGTTIALAIAGLSLGVAAIGHASLTPIASNLANLQTGTAGVVAWANPNSSGASDELQIAQDLLDYNAGVISSSPISGLTFTDNTAGSGGTALSYGDGTVKTTAVNSVDSSGNLGASITSGYDFAIAKYGGPGGGGYILFYLGGNSVILPQYSHQLWGANGTGQYGISGYTEFDVSGNTLITKGGVPVPEPSTILAGTLLLLPFGMSTFRMLRRYPTA